MQFRELTSDVDLEVGYRLLSELRTGLERGEFKRVYDAARAADGYQLWGAFVQDVCVGVMGLRTLHDYVHGKHLYIDDLVVTKERRSLGVGAQFLKHAEELAAKTSCRGLRLSTGIDNNGGRKFYEREGWILRSVTFKKKFS